MFVNKLKMDEIAEAVKKCMDEADLEETGLRKAAYAAHTKGEKMFSFKGKTYPVKVQGEEVSYGEEIKEGTNTSKDAMYANVKHEIAASRLENKAKQMMKAKEAEKQKIKEASCEDEVKKHEKRLHGKDGEVSKHVDKMHKEELSPKQKKIAKLNHPKDEIDAGDLAKLRGEEVELDEADKVATSTGMKVYGSSYGDSVKARRDQLKRPVDDTKGPNKSQLAQMAKVKKEEFFKDRLITNYIEEEAQFEAELNEVLSKDATAADWIHDFVHSDNPQFAGKSVKKRQKMALAAYYAKQRNESVEDSYPVTTDTLAGRMPGGMSNSFKQFKLRVRPTDKESEDKTNLIPVNRPAHMTARDPHIGHGGSVTIPPAGVIRKEEVELDEKEGYGGSDPLANRASYAKKHGTGQVYKKTYPGDKVGMTKAHAYDIKRTGPKGKLPEEIELNEVSKSEVEHHFHNWTNSEHAPYNSDAGNDNKVHQSALRYLRSTNVPKENHEKMAMHIAHKFHGSGIDESTPPKNTDVADKSYLKDMGKKPTVKSDLKNFKNFLTGKKETNEGKQPETDNVPFVTNAEQPPFDGPYKKIDKTTTDKSGAKHTPMSRARDLAQSAMKRVKTEMLGKAPGNNG